MEILKSIVSFFKKVFSKQEEIKMLEAPVEINSKQDKSKFMDSLKINLVEKKKKKKVETLTCVRRWIGNTT